MIKTFVFGTPYGFDLYEKDPLYIKYFQGFYISTRKGQRLMVNRRDNGETIYSYIHYGFKEKSTGRPAKGLFGMALAIDESLYCPEFNKMFDWFEYLFETIKNTKNIFKLTDSEIYQYTIDKFADNTADVEWIKSVMPNIVKSANAGMSLVKYDDLFSKKKSGKILKFNDKEEQVKILNGFRQCRWICLSPDNIAEPELDYAELLDCYNELNEKVLPIAINPTKDKKNFLVESQKDCIEYKKSIDDYLKSFVNNADDKQVYDSFHDLADKYKSLSSQIGSLLYRINSGNGIVVVPPTQKRTCQKCGRSLPLHYFSNDSIAICKDCERQNPPVQKKRCVKCGQMKPITSFHDGKNVCIQCENTSGDSGKIDFLQYLTPKNIMIVAIALVAIIVSILAINKCSGGKDDGPTDRDGDSVTIITPPVVDDDNVDKAKLTTLLAQGSYSEALSYINKCKDGESYKSQIHAAVSDSIDNIFQTNIVSDIKNKLQEFLIVNKALMDDVGFTEDERAAKEKYADDYIYVQNVLKKQMSIQEYNKAKQLAQQYGLEQELKLLDTMWAAQQTQETIRNNQNNTSVTVLIDGANPIKCPPQKYRVGKVGQTITIKGGPVRFVSGNAPGTLTGNNIKLTKVGKAVYECNGIQITIEAKAKKSSTTSQIDNSKDKNNGRGNNGTNSQNTDTHIPGHH